MIDLDATLQLTFACHSQQSNQITSLDGAKFPSGLTGLHLVSFHHSRLCFVVCLFVMCEARAVRMLHD